MGDLLFAAVNVARHLGVDAEAAVREASAKFRRRFRAVEDLARPRTLSDLFARRDGSPLGGNQAKRVIPPG
jgi:uncharacterized protein YabN with tetrapyrrole methylase and pyrophosphatase domain